MKTANPDPSEQQAPSVPGPTFLKRFEDLLVVVSAVCILSIGVLITMSVLTRALFSWSFPDTVVITQELMISCVILPLACVTAERAHIMVEVFTSMMPGIVQPWLNLLSSVIGFIVIVPFMYGGYVELRDVLVDEAYFFGDLELPEWPGRLAFFVGYVTFVVRLAVLVFFDFLSVLGTSAPPASPTPNEN